MGVSGVGQEPQQNVRGCCDIFADRPPAGRALPRRGEPVAVYLRCGHIVKVGRGFDEDAFKRVVAILDGGG